MHSWENDKIPQVGINIYCEELLASIIKLLWNSITAMGGEYLKFVWWPNDSTTLE